MSTDWAEWHDAYARPGSGLRDRLAAVRAQIERHLDATAPDPVRVVSACAGDGRDLLGVLVGADGREPRHGALGRVRRRRGCDGPRGRRRLAGTIESGRLTRPGVTSMPTPCRPISCCCAAFSATISDADVRATVEAAPELCAPGAEVIWTRHRNDPDLTPAIRGWFADSGFEELAFIAPEGEHWSVGVHRLAAEPRPSRARPPLVHVHAVTVSKPAPPFWAKEATMSEQGWREFLAADGVDDWVVLHGGATAVFRVPSLSMRRGLPRRSPRCPASRTRGPC